MQQGIQQTFFVTGESSFDGLRGTTINNVTAITVHYYDYDDKEVSCYISFVREVPWRCKDGTSNQGTSVGGYTTDDNWWDISIEEDVTITEIYIYLDRD